MNQRITQWWMVMMLLNIPAHAYLPVAPYVSVRSLATYVPREMVGCHDLVNRHDAQAFYANFFAQPGVTCNFESKEIARLLFGDALKCAARPCHNGALGMHISGSHVANRASTDLLADYFGLPVDFESDVFVDPKISNFFCDFNLYMGLDNWLSGLFFNMYAPFVHTRWELNPCECNIKTGTQNYLPGYMSDVLVSQTVGVQRPQLLTSFSSFALLRKAPTVGGSVIFEPLKQARWYQGVKTDNRLADLHLVLGWNFMRTDTYHVGLSMRASAATGTRPCGEFLFEPIAGNGRHWELGGGLDACCQLWSSADETDCVSGFLEFRMSHLGRTHQMRTFDVCGKPLSRYMLVERMSCTINNDLQSVDGDEPSRQFDNVLLPLANVSTMAVRVHADFQTDLALMLSWTHRHLTFDIGYNFFDRTRERIIPCFDPCSPIFFQAHPWTLKGDAFVYGFTKDGADNLVDPVALSASQAQATIYQGTNNPPDGIDGVDWNRNPGVDNKKLAQGESPAENLYTKNSAGTAGQMYSSFNPRMIQMSDLDTTGTKLRSHSFFFNFSHSWDHRADITPYLGFGAQFEMGIDCKKQMKRKCSTTPNSCVPCNSPFFCLGLDTTVWQCAIWLKGGVAFK